MKRLLSIILAVAMIAAFIPAVSASGPIDATENMKLVYNFCDGSIDASSDAQARTTAGQVTYDKTKGFWAFNYGLWFNNSSYGKALDGGIRIKQHYDSAQLCYYSVKINVPEAGTYKIALDLQTQNGGWGDVYLYKLGATEAMVEANLLKSTGSGIHSYITTQTKIDGLDLGTKTLDAGEWVVAFAVPFDESFDTNTRTYNWFHPCKLTLTSGDVATSQAVPFIKEYTAPAAQIDANTGKTTMAISTATVLSDSVTEAGEVTVEYSSSNDNIAKVDSNGNITAGVDGTATITAKVTAANSDCYVTKTAMVKVGTGEFLDPNGVKIVYNFGKSPTGKTELVQHWYDYTNTNGFFAHRASYMKGKGDIAYNGDGAEPYTLRIERKSGKGDYLYFLINVPKTGDYDVYLDWNSTGKNVTFDVYAGGDFENLTKLGNISATAATAKTVTKLTSEKLHLNQGENYFGFVVPEGFTVNSTDGWLVVYDISLVAGSSDAIMGAEMTAPEAPLAIGATDVVSATGYLSSTGAIASFTYESDNTDAVIVNSTTGAIKAVGAGNATITATCADALAGYNTISKTITVAAPEAPKAPNVALYVTASKGDAVSVIVNGAEKDINTALSEKRGANVTVTANDYEGHTFRGWVRGSAEHGVWVSSEPTYSFVAMTNNMLTAIYEENISGNVVEYYNENGAYIETKAASAAPTAAPALSGYTFSKWMVSENDELDISTLTASLTRAVAKHTANRNAGTVTVNGVARSETTFDTAINLTASKAGFTAWKRDGKVVSYNKDYTYYVWSDTEISESTEAIDEKLPIVVLDADKVDSSWMVEYDGAGFEIAEVGIIFGNNADIDIDSCMVKANSQRNSAHGQFAATSEYGVARGYIIYKDGGEYKVIYSE